MPELPEVETTCRGIRPHVTGAILKKVLVRNARLRVPVPENLEQILGGQTLNTITRRAKYMLFNFPTGSLIVHLGMSGSLRIVETDEPAGIHDHVDLVFEKQAVRLRDPRRFGLVVWQAGNGLEHPLLSRLGIEPLSSEFDGACLHALCHNRRMPIKQVLMDGHRIVGVGNIYASESLFRAQIHPLEPAGNLSLQHCTHLVTAIREILAAAIQAGGSTLRNFVGGDGQPGYFQQYYNVYGRKDQPCHRCMAPIQRIVLGQRSTFFCPECQVLSG